MDERIVVKASELQKPPLGLEPENIWKAKCRYDRALNILAAMKAWEFLKLNK